MPTIAPNLLQALFRQTYFVCGPACGEKSALVRALAETHRGVMCGGDYHEELLHLADPACQGALLRFGPEGDASQAAASALAPEEYAAWADDAGREAAGLELLLLIRLTAYGRPIFVDTRIPPETLQHIGAQAMVLLPPPAAPDGSPATPEDPAARACLAALNTPARRAAWEGCGFPVCACREDSAPEELLAFAGAAFGLDGSAGSSAKEATPCPPSLPCPLCATSTA